MSDLSGGWLVPDSPPQPQPTPKHRADFVSSSSQISADRSGDVLYLRQLDTALYGPFSLSDENENSIGKENSVVGKKNSIAKNVPQLSPIMPHLNSSQTVAEPPIQLSIPGHFEPIMSDEGNLQVENHHLQLGKHQRMQPYSGYQQEPLDFMVPLERAVFNSRSTQETQNQSADMELTSVVEGNHHEILSPRENRVNAGIPVIGPDSAVVVAESPFSSSSSIQQTPILAIDRPQRHQNDDVILAVNPRTPWTGSRPGSAMSASITTPKTPFARSIVDESMTAITPCYQSKSGINQHQYLNNRPVDRPRMGNPKQLMAPPPLSKLGSMATYSTSSSLGTDSSESSSELQSSTSDPFLKTSSTTTGISSSSIMSSSINTATAQPDSSLLPRRSNTDNTSINVVTDFGFGSTLMLLDQQSSQQSCQESQQSTVGDRSADFSADNTADSVNNSLYEVKLQEHTVGPNITLDYVPSQMLQFNEDNSGSQAEVTPDQGDSVQVEAAPAPQAHEPTLVEAVMGIAGNHVDEALENDVDRTEIMPGFAIESPGTSTLNAIAADATVAAIDNDVQISGIVLDKTLVLSRGTVLESIRAERESVVEDSQETQLGDNDAEGCNNVVLDDGFEDTQATVVVAENSSPNAVSSTKRELMKSLVENVDPIELDNVMMFVPDEIVGPIEPENGMMPVSGENVDPVEPENVMSISGESVGSSPQILSSLINREESVLRESPSPCINRAVDVDDSTANALVQNTNEASANNQVAARRHRNLDDLFNDDDDDEVIIQSSRKHRENRFDVIPETQEEAPVSHSPVVPVNSRETDKKLDSVISQVINTRTDVLSPAARPTITIKLKTPQSATQPSSRFSATQQPVKSSQDSVSFSCEETSMTTVDTNEAVSFEVLKNQQYNRQWALARFRGKQFAIPFELDSKHCAFHAIADSVAILKNCDRVSWQLCPGDLCHYCVDAQTDPLPCVIIHRDHYDFWILLLDSFLDNGANIPIKISWTQLLLDENDLRFWEWKYHAGPFPLVSASSSSSRSHTPKAQRVRSTTASPVYIGKSPNTSNLQTKSSKRRSALSVSPQASAQQKRSRHGRRDFDMDKGFPAAMFRGYQFWLTSTDKDSAEDRDELQKWKEHLIKAQADILDFPLPTNFSSSRRSSDKKKQYLIAYRACRSTKYLLALADGIPRVSIGWLRECCRLGRILQVDDYLLPNGIVYDDDSHETIPPTLQSKGIFDGLYIFLLSSFLRENERETWNTIIRAAGGQVPTRRTSPLLTYFLLLDEAPVDPKLIQQAHSSAPGKPILTKEWLCLSLIRQHRLDPDDFIFHMDMDSDDQARNRASSSATKSNSKTKSTSTRRRSRR